ncbi:MAG: VWA domain-containing protein, partial [Myxococcota bacterium]
MSELAMVFAQPELAWLMWIWAALLLLLVWLERRGSDALDRLVSEALQDRLVIRPSHWRRWTRLALIGLSGFAMIIALMQPQWGLRHVSTPRVGAEIMIALDVSRSMLADDAKPSRLARAKAEISDLLSYLKDDYVGLIAFAGRATILSPMTPDKSFLRLALDSAGPHSVTRGGTRLAEPILRAVAGMGEEGPSQRALILITDGEDHDSFALDAAKQPAEAGIKIITIGFGDEKGSPIYLRDSKTGVRRLLRDADGQAVISRLDGDLLREIALATDGAFVPAGTGVLDLASIYDEHIADLTRGQLEERGRTIRDEAYQFFLLVAMISLIAAVATSAGGGSRRKAATGASLFFAVLLFSALPLESWAQAPPPISSAPPLESEEISEHESGFKNVNSGESPRVKFNRANERLRGGDSAAAEALLREARRDAKNDAELRYAATYNLGIAAVARADSLHGQQQSDALDALYVAADWFREAAVMKPEASDPRHNLDVTLRRALMLADELAKKNQIGIEAELDTMIETQREHVMRAAALLEEIVRSGELDVAEILRPAFRDAATGQRLVLSDVETLAERVSRERQALLGRPEAARSPEEMLRTGQLEAVLKHLDGAIDRIGQTRRQFRQRRAERAYRRGSSALGELKRARDQLRNPVEQIGILLAEIAGLARSTAALEADGLSPEVALPAFLTRESTESDSQRIRARVEELARRLINGAEQAQSAMEADGFSATFEADQPLTAEEANRAAQHIGLMEAAPLVEGAAKSMVRVSERIAAGEYHVALNRQIEVAEALAAAQERFFDLAQLLNATFAVEQKIAEISGPLYSENLPMRDEFASSLAALQEENLARTLRLEDLLEQEERIRITQIEAQAESVVGPSGQGDETAIDEERDSENRRFQMARQRLALASGAMMEVADGFAGAGEAKSPNWSKINEASVRASTQLDAIRALFFSIVEHLRKLAMDQADVRDQTQDALALAVTEAPEAETMRPVIGENSAASETASSASESSLRGPETMRRTSALAVEQAGLAIRATEIADALLAQAEAIAEAPSEEAGPQAEAEGLRIRQAAESVASAGLAMTEALETLQADSRPLSPALAAENLAIEDLQKALEILSPPSPSEESKPSEDDSNQNQASGEEEASQESEPSQDAQQPSPEN